MRTVAATLSAFLLAALLGLSLTVLVAQAPPNQLDTTLQKLAACRTELGSLTSLHADFIGGRISETNKTREAARAAVLKANPTLAFKGETWELEPQPEKPEATK